MKLEIKGACFSYGSRPVLENVTMSIKEGEVVSIVGPNGSGKSTLLKCINRILKPEGNILVDGTDLARVKSRDLAKLLGYVPQSINHSFPATVFDTVLLGRKPYVDWSISSEDIEIVSNIISLMGLKDMALRQSNELSGGERQKVFMARALAQEPEVLLLDEPTSNLDMRHQLDVLDIVRSLVNMKKTAAVMAIHDLNLAAQFSDRLILLENGKIYEAGTPAEVITVENIRRIYGVEVDIINNSRHLHIIPVVPMNSGPEITSEQVKAWL